MFFIIDHSILYFIYFFLIHRLQYLLTSLIKFFFENLFLTQYADVKRQTHQKCHQDDFICDFSFPLFLENKSFYCFGLTLSIFFINRINIFFHRIIVLKLISAFINSILVFWKFHKIMSLPLFFRELSQQRVVSHLYFLGRSFYLLRHELWKLLLNFLISQRFLSVLERIHFIVFGGIFLLLSFFLIVI